MDRYELLEPYRFDWSLAVLRGDSWVWVMVVLLVEPEAEDGHTLVALR